MFKIDKWFLKCVILNDKKVMNYSFFGSFYIVGGM